MKPSQLPLLLLAAATTTLAQDWHFVAFTTPDGQEFISQSGNMIVPAIHEAATNYLWPGLQSTDNSGVYQNVLDGRSGGWWFGSGWCCSNPSLPWGGGFGAAEGDVLFFNNTRNTDSSEWVSVIEKNCGEASATNSFPIADKVMNDAPFAAELYGAWDFGPVIFEDVILIATGDDTRFCTDNPWNYNGATNVSITGVTSTVGVDTVTCNIESITLWGPV
ncbi:hypothetical protein D6D24_05752 [Aureobasidium pullulans]|uniref:Concanavalin A-like lectin/glucanase n=1 Tax=Aureobasidium pullulans TaxID=5580 RepID=A0A4S8VQF6_AURPU|nr:hypothetical protein D6D24_05752 [Aureobasidium pullulans]THW40850.1 hypothetical protein D6D22_05658 [Aureobasidium pullulans]